MDTREQQRVKSGIDARKNGSNTRLDLKVVRPTANVLADALSVATPYDFAVALGILRESGTAVDLAVAIGVLREAAARAEQRFDPQGATH